MPADRNARTRNASAPRGLRAPRAMHPRLASIKTVVGLIDREASIERARGGVLDRLAWQSLRVTRHRDRHAVAFHVSPHPTTTSAPSGVSIGRPPAPGRRNR